MKLITPNEYETLRKLKCQQLGIRYTKLAPKQLLDAVIQHNTLVRQQAKDPA